MENDLQQYARQYMYQQNNRSVTDFEGYSPNEMQQLLYDPFGPDSPLNLNKLDDAGYNAIPIFNLVRHLMRHLSLSIDLTRILCDITGLTKKRYNKISLTKTGEKLLGDNSVLFHKLLMVFGYKFNWAYFDRFSSSFRDGRYQKRASTSVTRRMLHHPYAPV